MTGDKYRRALHGLDSLSTLSASMRGRGQAFNGLAAVVSSQGSRELAALLLGGGGFNIYGELPIYTARNR